MTNKTQTTICSTERLILSRYAELDSQEQAQVETHLLGCPTCRAELAALEDILQQLPTEAPELTTGELKNFGSRVMDQLPRRQGFKRPALGWALAATVVLLLSLNLSWQQPGETPLPLHPLMPQQQQMVVGQELADQLELLQNLDLLENLDLLQQLANLG